MNLIRTGLLMAALTGLFLAGGYLLGGQSGMVFAFLFALGTNGFAYWNADKMVLRMYNARQASDAEAADLVHLVRRLSESAGLPMPKVFIVDNPQPNAFATGRNPDHAAVAVTSGLLQRLDQEQLAGVLAHELTHVKNRDTIIMSITATIAGAIGMLASFALFFGRFGGRRNNPLGIVGVLLVMLFATLAAVLVQLSISRSREYAADAGGAMLSGRPLWLASALKRIESAASRIDNVAAEAHPVTAHMFIVNPLHGGHFDGLFRTHPSTPERIARLEHIAAQMGETVPPGP